MPDMENEGFYPPYDPSTAPEPVDKVKPFREAGLQRQRNAEINAEQDELNAEILFEMTMKDLGG